MSYQVLARKWRPQTFAEMVGQEHVTQTLGNALSRGRVAHAYLFTGPRGCGKTTMARLLAKALNCDRGPTPTPCGECPSCLGIAQGSFLDVLEIDAASNTGVDNIRELRENAQFQPTAGKKRVFIIDEVHMLSKGAFNALLKTLEEPPQHVHFIFATTEPVRIPRTILSRCQRFDFRLFRLEELIARLREIAKREKLAISDGAIELLASLAEGSMRDALSLFDQATSSADGELSESGVIELYGLIGNEVYARFNDLILARDAKGALDLIDELARSGHDLVEFARGLVGNLRDLLLLRIDASLAERVEKPESVKVRLREQAARFAAADLLLLTQRAAENYLQLERAPQPRWLLEAQVVEYAQHESQILLSELLGRIDAMAGGGAGAAGASGGARGRGASGSSSTPRTRAEGARAAAELASESEYELLLRRMREENQAVGSCLLQAAPRIAQDSLTLVFAPEHDFHRTQIDTISVRQRLSQLAAECFGRTIQVQIETQQPDQGEETSRLELKRRVAPTAKQELEELSRREPGLGRLIEGLGGEVVEG